MRLVFLGTAGYHPNDQRQTLCMVIPECGVMLDAGTAVYRAAQVLQTSEIDIFLTHAHLDHVVGLTYLFDLFRARPLSRVTVHGEGDKLSAIQTHLFAEALFPKRPPVEFRPFSAATVMLLREGRLTWFPLAHPGGSVGFRLDWPGHSMAYVTDTVAGPESAYEERIRGVDLLVHECYFDDAHADLARLTGHSHTTPVAELARRAAVGQLILTHVNPASGQGDPVGLDIARAILPSTDLAWDGMVVDF